MDRPAPIPLASYPYQTRMTTRWRDNDVYRHMNNVVYYEYFDTVVNGWLVTNGLVTLEGDGPVALAVDSRCSHFYSLGFPGAVIAALRADRIGGSSVTYGVGLFAEGRSDPAAQGRFVHVFVERSTHRPTPIPEAARTALAALTAP